MPVSRPARSWKDWSLAGIDMCCTCKYSKDMPTMIQLRHVPDDLHRKLKARAAIEGMSLSDYIIREIRQLAEKPTMSEMMARLARRKPVHLKTSPVEILRELRDGRDRG